MDTLATTREVVDGQQRLRTLISFIEPVSLLDFNTEHDDFVISRSHNEDLAGKKFSEFPDKVRKTILSYQIPVHILPPDTADSQVLDIFRRMNATGTKLSDQELRNAAFFGQFIQSVYTLALANLHRWRRWGMFSEQQIARMDEAEFMSELYMFVINGLTDRTQAAITKAYADHETDFPSRDRVEFRIAHVLSIIEETFGDHIRGTRLTNKGIFYVLFGVIYYLVFGSDTPIQSPPRTDIRATVQRGLRAAAAALGDEEKLPESVKLALASRSNSKSSRETVFGFLNGFFVI